MEEGEDCVAHLIIKIKHKIKLERLRSSNKERNEKAEADRDHGHLICQLRKLIKINMIFVVCLPGRLFFC